MNNTKVADLSVDEFKNLIRETMTQTLAELFNDPDEGLALRDESSAELLAALKEPKVPYKSAQTLTEELGLDW